MIDKLGDASKTDRGLQIIIFKDTYQVECSLQESSNAAEPAIWLGVDKADPYINLGKGLGWTPFPLPKEMLITSRMHLNKEMVRKLILHLQKWLEEETLDL